MQYEAAFGQTNGQPPDNAITYEIGSNPLS